MIHKLQPTNQLNITARKFFRVPARNVQKTSVPGVLERPWSAASYCFVWRGRWWLCRPWWPDTPGQIADRRKASQQAASPWGSWWAPSWHGPECEGGAKRRAYQAFGSKLGAWLWCKSWWEEKVQYRWWKCISEKMTVVKKSNNLIELK